MNTASLFPFLSHVSRFLGYLSLFTAFIFAPVFSLFLFWDSGIAIPGSRDTEFVLSNLLGYPSLVIVATMSLIAVYYLLGRILLDLAEILNPPKSRPDPIAFSIQKLRKFPRRLVIIFALSFFLDGGFSYRHEMKNPGSESPYAEKRSEGFLVKLTMPPFAGVNALVYALIAHVTLVWLKEKQSLRREVQELRAESESTI